MKASPPGTGSFVEGGISEHFIWNLDLILWSVLNGLSLTTQISEDLSSWHWQFCARGVYLRMLSENLNSLWVWLLLHRGLFYEWPIKGAGKNVNRWLLFWLSEVVPCCRFRARLFASKKGCTNFTGRNQPAPVQAFPPPIHGNYLSFQPTFFLSILVYGSISYRYTTVCATTHFFFRW